ncbi:hypothetical protein DPMN_042284 [Dreissena polymorpha]|uniref:Uncharacterized protein n=1 Tax=Dreissena polymorpha TaxID=45954 RepID=A0A9D4D066_DREPO|nr:hypothetical protein DPMN_042284 [Dreissena polymorpha]
MSPKNAPHLLYKAQELQVCPEHDCNTCWSVRALTGDRQTTKFGLVWKRHLTRLSVQDCSPGRSTSKKLEKKLDGICKRVNITSRSHNRPD